MKKLPLLIIISVMLIQCCGLRQCSEMLPHLPHFQDDPGDITINTPEESSPTPTATRIPDQIGSPTPKPIPNVTFTPTLTTTISQTSARTISEVFMVTALEGWALAGLDWEGSQLLRTEDGGENWQPVFIMPENLTTAGATTFAGSFPDSLTAWLTPYGEDFVPADTVVFYTSDGGESWETSQPFPTYGAGEFYKVFITALDKHQAWLFTQITVLGTGANHSQRLFHTDDGGEYWEETVLILYDINGMEFLNENIGILASELEGAYQPPLPALTYLTNDGGKTWEENELPIPPASSSVSFNHCRSKFPKLFTVSAGSLMVTCFDDWSESVSHSFFHSSDNGGASWNTHELPATRSVWMFDQNSGWTYGPGMELYQTTDGGGTWNRFDLNFSGEIRSISFSDEKHGWLTVKMDSNDTSLFRTVDGGSTWEAVDWDK